MTLSTQRTMPFGALQQRFIPHAYALQKESAYMLALKMLYEPETSDAYKSQPEILEGKAKIEIPVVDSEERACLSRQLDGLSVKTIKTFHANFVPHQSNFQDQEWVNDLRYLLSECKNYSAISKLLEELNLSQQDLKTCAALFYMLAGQATIDTEFSQKLSPEDKRIKPSSTLYRIAFSFEKLAKERREQHNAHPYFSYCS